MRRADEDAPRARFRRRRLRALGLLAGASALTGAIVGAGAGEETAPAPVVLSYCAQPGPGAPVRQAGQGVMVRMEARASAPLLRAVRRGEVGGVILFPPEGIRGERLAAEIARVREAADRAGMPAPLVAIDQEGGIVERLPALAPQLSPYTIAQNDDADAARLEGAAAGFQLGKLGVDVNLAPVLDVPASPEQFMAPRAFGSSPQQVSRLGLAFAKALQSEGMAATAKHFPGLGRATENTDFAPTSVSASRTALRADLEPFEAAAAAGVRLVMVSSASYPALGSETPAVTSPAIVSRLLRKRLGYQGVVITDDLLAPAISTSLSAERAALAAKVAGVDVLLFAARDVTGAGIARSLARAAADGRLPPATLRASCDRIVALKDELAAAAPLP